MSRKCCFKMEKPRPCNSKKRLVQNLIKLTNIAAIILTFYHRIRITMIEVTSGENFFMMFSVRIDSPHRYWKYGMENCRKYYIRPIRSSILTKTVKITVITAAAKEAIKKIYEGTEQ